MCTIHDTLKGFYDEHASRCEWRTFEQFVLELRVRAFFAGAASGSVLGFVVGLMF